MRGDARLDDGPRAPHRGARRCARSRRTPGAARRSRAAPTSWSAGTWASSTAATVVDLSRVAEWKKIAVAEGRASRIGSLGTHSRHPTTSRSFALAFPFWSPPAPRRRRPDPEPGHARRQRRQRLARRRHLPPLCPSTRRRIHCVGPAGRRAVSIHEIFAGVKKTSLRPGELIEAIELPFPAKPPTRGVFRKVGTRAAQSISKTMFAGLLWLGKDGTVADAALSRSAAWPRR